MTIKINTLALTLKNKEFKQGQRHRQKKKFNDRKEFKNLVHFFAVLALTTT